MIDMALHKYFEKDRYFTRGDVFRHQLELQVCVSCSRRMQIGSDDIIYFKVMAMEPSDEPILRVDRTKTALVLGGSVPSVVPLDLLISRSKGSVPLQGDTVENLASILTYATSMSIRTLIKVQSFCPVACMVCLVCFLYGL